MPGTPTSRLAIPTLTGTDFVSDGPSQINAALTAIDTVAATDDQGTAFSRPTSTVGSPGKRGRYYFGTDSLRLWRDYGTGWDEIIVNAVRGQVSSTGTVVSGSGFTPSRGGTGLYFVALADIHGTMHPTYSVTVTPLTSPTPVVAIVSGKTTGAFTVETFSLAGTHADCAFMFHALRD